MCWTNRTRWRGIRYGLRQAASQGGPYFAAVTDCTGFAALTTATTNWTPGLLLTQVYAATAIRIGGLTPMAMTTVLLPKTQPMQKVSTGTNMLAMRRIRMDAARSRPDVPVELGSVAGHGRYFCGMCYWSAALAARPGHAVPPPLPPSPTGCCSEWRQRPAPPRRGTAGRIPIQGSYPGLHGNFVMSDIPAATGRG